MSNQNPHTVCIIGGGMSGLFTGALLAKNGYQVTVLEKNHIIGGGLQSFRRGDAVFNTGMQAFAGYVPGMISLQVCKYLGISESLNVMPTDSNKQEIIWVDNSTCYHLPQGREAYEAYLIAHFPHEEKGIRELIEQVFRIGHTFDYLFLNSIQRHVDNIPYAYMNAYEFVYQYIKDECLITILEYIGWTTGHSLKAMPALEFCMMMTLYVIGSHRFVGGAIQMADELNYVIEESGGKVVNDVEVCKVVVKNNRVDRVIDENGNDWNSEVYVWACSPKILVDICNTQVFRPAMMQRIQEYINPFSGYIVFCKLKSNTFPFINSAVYMRCPSENENFPQSVVLVTTPKEEQGQWAETLEIYKPAAYADVMRWQNSRVEQRGKEYVKYKYDIAHQLIDTISHYYPDLKDAISDINVASGLTIRDYYGNPNGACYGQQGLYVPIKTKLPNLFMTGQAVQNQGIAGIATTSTLTAETILGKSLIEKIAKA